MKIQVKLIIFVIGFGFSFISTESFAKEDKSTIHRAGLSKGNEKAFEQYINEQFTPFIEQDEWKIFVEVVTLYNQSPSKLGNIEAEEQNKFKSAVQLLNHTLNNSTDKEAKIWLDNLRKTAHNIQFLWKNNPVRSLPEFDNTESLSGEPISMLNGF